MKRGFTLIELLVVMAIISLLIGLLLPVLAQARATAKLLKDGTQLRSIQQSWVTYSREFDGRFPTPGRIHREPDPVLGQDVPGRGPEDVTVNTTANLHSVCIGQNFYSPEICVGPTEPSSKVFVKDDYNWALISPVNDVFWDESFVANVSATGSNVSYASIPIAGERKQKQWKDSLDAQFAAIGNRGVKWGDFTNPGTYESSLTLQIHGGSKQWVGYVCFNDNHTEVLRTFLLEGLTYRDPATGQSAPDNIFRNDSGGDGEVVEGFDNYLTIVDRIIAANGQVFGIFESWD